MRPTLVLIGLTAAGAFAPCMPAPLRGAELATLNESNWSELAPVGKEADCIYGDYVLRNDRIIVAIGEAIPTRNANMRMRQVGGCVIDLTERADPNDQFGALYPAPGRELTLHSIRVDGKKVELGPATSVEGGAIELVFDAAAPAEAGPAATCRVVYRLADGDDGLTITNEYSNPGEAAVATPLEDSVRVDSEFKTGIDADQQMYWANDAFWRQAYCLLAEDRPLVLEPPRDYRSGPALHYDKPGEPTTLAPGANATLVRHIFPASNELAARAKALRHKGLAFYDCSLKVLDDVGPVSNAIVTIRQGERTLGVAQTDADGRLEFALPEGEFVALVKHHARGEKTLPFKQFEGSMVLEFLLDTCGYVSGTITDGDGGRIACKVDFEGVDGTPNPDFGPDSAIYGVRNLAYTPDGKFRAELLPGKYRVLISHGPEFDAESREIEVTAGETTTLDAQLARFVDTGGWISADFHSHSSPSGDNAASQRGRVLNLLAEHIEFAPCTEHNRVTNYGPQLVALDAVDRLATCPGMELTGQPLPLNHQNAFPLIEHTHAQDGGGPTAHPDPTVQIERLALWDDRSDKFVQVNHPNITQMIGDKDLDGRPDGGFEQMFGFMDVIEVHPPEQIFTRPTEQPSARDLDDFGNKMFNWMQLLNLGYRVPGVVNTDAHWNYHGSGWLRNYLRSSTDDPARIQPMDMVHAAEHGQMVMTNGPFLTVAATSGDKTAGVGDDLAATDGRVRLHIRVQCANWLDVNRVQVFINGRPQEQFNFTRRAHGIMFGTGSVKFDQTVDLELTADAHVIVAVGNEGATLGRVYGPDSGKVMPVAVANPIFVDVDGGGFQHNGDDLDLPLPVTHDAPQHVETAGE
jgi:hypothetical protein